MIVEELEEGVVKCSGIWGNCGKDMSEWWGICYLLLMEGSVLF